MQHPEAQKSVLAAFWFLIARGYGRVVALDLPASALNTLKWIPFAII